MAQWNGTLDPSLRGTPHVEEVEAAMLAVEGFNAGSADPPNPRPGQIVIDTTLGVVKQRNQANDAWTVLWIIDGAPLHLQFLSKLAADTPVALDRNSPTTIFVNMDTALAPFVLTLPDPTTVAFRFWLIARDYHESDEVVEIHLEDTGTQTFSMGLGTDPLVLAKPNEFVLLYPLGNSWQILSHNLSPERRVSGNYTLTMADKLLLIDASGGNVTITLPLIDPTLQTAALNDREFLLKRIDGSGNTVTVEADASDYFDSDGSAGGTRTIGAWGWLKLYGYVDPIGIPAEDRWLITGSG